MNITPTARSLNNEPIGKGQVQRVEGSGVDASIAKSILKTTTSTSSNNPYKKEKMTMVTKQKQQQQQRRHVTFPKDNSKLITEIIEIPCIEDDDEKQIIWYTKKEIKQLRAAIQEEELLIKVKEMVHGKLIKERPYLNENEVEIEVNKIVDGGNDAIIKFMEDTKEGSSGGGGNNKKSSSTKKKDEKKRQRDEEMAKTVRKLVYEKVIEMDICQTNEEINDKVNMIMIMPKHRIKEFLIIPIVQTNADNSNNQMNHDHQNQDYDDKEEYDYSQEVEQEPYEEQQPPPPSNINWLTECNDIWDDVPTNIQHHLSILGYSKGLWDEFLIPKTIRNKTWDDLSIEQQLSAQYIGLTQFTWFLSINNLMKRQQEHQEELKKQKLENPQQNFQQEEDEEQEQEDQIDEVDEALEENKRSAAEQARLQAEEQRKAEEEARIRKEKRIAEKKARKEEELRIAEEKARKDEEQRIAEEKARKEAEEEARRRKEEHQRIAREARLKAEEEARIKKEKRLAEEARLKEEAERKRAKLAEEARIKEEARLAEEERRKAELEAKRLADEKTKLKVELEAKRKADKEAKLKIEAQAKAAEEARLAEQGRLKAEAEEKAKAAEQARLKAEAEEHERIAKEARLVEEARRKAETEKQSKIGEGEQIEETKRAPATQNVAAGATEVDAVVEEYEYEEEIIDEDEDGYEEIVVQDGETEQGTSSTRKSSSLPQWPPPATTRTAPTLIPQQLPQQQQKESHRNPDVTHDRPPPHSPSVISPKWKGSPRNVEEKEGNDGTSIPLRSPTTSGDKPVLISPGSKNTKSLVNKFEQMIQSSNNPNSASSDGKGKVTMTPRSIQSPPLVSTVASLTTSPPGPLPLHNANESEEKSKNIGPSDINKDTTTTMTSPPSGNESKEMKKEKVSEKETKDVTNVDATVPANAACCVIL